MLRLLKLRRDTLPTPRATDAGVPRDVVLLVVDARRALRLVEEPPRVLDDRHLMPRVVPILRMGPIT